jgi:hypothetical protein
MSFALPQEVSRHVRERACVFRPDEMKSDTSSGRDRVSEKVTVPSTSADVNSKEEDDGDRFIKCSRCSYRTESRAELLFHEVLHGEPITDPSGTEAGLGTTTSQTQVICLIYLQAHFAASIPLEMAVACTVNNAVSTDNFT